MLSFNWREIVSRLSCSFYEKLASVPCELEFPTYISLFTRSSASLFIFDIGTGGRKLSKLTEYTSSSRSSINITRGFRRRTTKFELGAKNAPIFVAPRYFVSTRNAEEFSSLL